MYTQMISLIFNMISIQTNLEKKSTKRQPRSVHLISSSTVLASTLLLALFEVSLLGYASPMVRTATPEPVCRKVPEEICEQALT